MAYGDSKDLTRRTAFDKILRDKTFILAKNPKYDGYQRGLASMVYKCLKTSDMVAQSETLDMHNTFVGSGIKNENTSN